VAVDEAKLRAAPDARVWANEWCKAAREIEAGGDGLVIDEGWMIGWFANAMELAADAVKLAAKAHSGPGALYGIVEIMGHRTRAGRLSDAQLGGATLLRIEHPTLTGSNGEPLAELYAPTAIFSVRLCDEGEAAEVAGWAWVHRVEQLALTPAFRQYVDVDPDEDLL
jgi:hypothetical protein